MVVSKLTRLMRLVGLSGKGKGGGPITTRTPTEPDLQPDLVNREFKAPRPGKPWVADITYVRTRKGFAYTAFVTDVFSRRIVGWALSDSMRTSGAAAPVAQPADCQCQGNFQGWFTIVPMARSVSALPTTSESPSTGLPFPPGLLAIPMTMPWPKNVNGSYKNGLIYTRMWNDAVGVESATFDWVNWWNESRLHQSLDYRTPTEVESELWSHQPAREIIENKANA